MAGIGFELKKLFAEDFFSKRFKAYLYSTIVAAGPWIVTIMTVNLFVLLAKHYFINLAEKDLFMGTVIYAFVFSQIFTAPWQLLITRYISDKLYQKAYKNVRASFMGVTKLILSISVIATIIYYYPKNIPLYYKFMAGVLFIFITLIWIVMIYLSTIKNYSLIVSGYLIGSIISLILAIILMNYPISFPEYTYASNLLLAYLVGTIMIYGILLYNFLASFPFTNKSEFDFLNYLPKFSSLVFIGLFYVLGLWIDDILMWYSSLGVNIYEIYRYAPLYDNAVFLSYLTTIPTIMLFMVSIETEFYDLYKQYYGLIINNAPYDQIEEAREEMTTSIYRQLIYTMESQTIITVTLVVLSGKIFSWMGMPLLIRDIFRICALGALCNIFILLIFLVLLYFEARIYSLIIAFVFFISNLLFTIYFIPKGTDFYGFGYFLSSFLTLILAIIMLVLFLKNITYHTFISQPIFAKQRKGFLSKLLARFNLSN